MIDIQGLEKKFNDRAIFSGLNLKLEKGKVYALIGKSGSGKTTLLNILGKLEKIDGGRVLYQGKDLKTTPTREYFRDQMGYLFQNFGLLENQSIKENLDLGFVGQKISKVERLERQVEALEKVNLGYLDLEQKIYTLSGGEAQRVALAKTILKNPPLILADEPTGNLDPKTAGDIIDLLKSLAEKTGKCVIVVTHSKEVAQASDITLELKDKKLTEK